MAILAIGLRLAALAEIRALGFVDNHLSDAAVYWERSAAITRGDWLGPADFVHAPLYAYVLGVLRMVTADDPIMPRIMQAVFGAIACVFVALAGRRLFSAGAGLAAGLLLAIHSPAIFADLLIQKTSIELLLSAALLWTVSLRPADTGSADDRSALTRCLPRAAGCGAVLGLLCLSRQNALVLIPLLAAWVSWPSAGSIRPRLAALAVFALAIAMVMLPWVARNRIVMGEIVLTTPNLGQNFAMGNSPRATGTYQPAGRGLGNAALEQQAWVVAAERAAGRPLSAREVSGFHLDRALDYIRSNPMPWLALTWRKWLMTWGDYEWPDTEDIYHFAERSTVLRAADATSHFGVLAPLAAAGIVCTWSGRRRLWVLYAWIALIALGVTAFVVFGRYRAPMLPVLAVFAGVAASSGVAWLGAWIRRRRSIDRSSVDPPRVTMRGAAAMLTALASALICNWAAHVPREPGAFAFVNHAITLADGRRGLEALAELERAFAIRPDDVEAEAVRGSVLLDLGRPIDALASYEAVKRLDPSWSAGPRGIGNALMALGRPEEAMPQFQAALALDPQDRVAANQLGAALAQVGRVDEAMVVLSDLAARQPRFAPAQLNLGNVFVAMGYADRAESSYRRAIELDPDMADALYNLAALLAARGRLGEAAQLVGDVLRVDPGHRAARELQDELSARRSSASRPP